MRTPTSIVDAFSEPSQAFKTKLFMFNWVLNSLNAIFAIIIYRDLYIDIVYRDLQSKSIDWFLYDGNFGV